MMRALAAALLLSAPPLSAEVAGFAPDYAGLFARHQAQVADQGFGRRVLELPGPVLVYEMTAADGSRAYRGLDQSGLGAAGCVFDQLVTATVVAGVCDGLIGARERTTLDAMTRAMARFTGANTHPPVPVQEVEPRLHAAIRDRAARLRIACPDPGAPVQGAAELLRAMTAKGGIAAVKRALKQPRLPVMAPCN